jgi:hypothetical protein
MLWKDYALSATRMQSADEKGLVEYDHPGVQLVREWLQRQPFSLRILTLILFMKEAVKDEFGEETTGGTRAIDLSNTAT